jgi:inward rectifier potassium channel
MIKEKFNDLGFGTKTANQKTRLLNQSGTFTTERRGQSRLDAFSWYHHMLNINLVPFLFILLIGYAVMNLAFTFIYLWVGVEHLTGMIANNFFDKFCEAFFFSTQTFTTVGYGRVNPQGFPANVVAAIESFTGLLAFAVATGMLYGRFARPKSHLIFSEHAVIAPYAATGKAIMFRIANRLEHLVIEVEATVMLAYIDKTKGSTRQFVTLELERNKIYFLPSMWTIVHPIDENSPFYNKSEHDVEEMDIELIVLIKAFDDSFSQTVHSRFSYKQFELVWNAKFVQTLFTDTEGKPYVEMDKLGSWEKMK